MASKRRKLSHEPDLESIVSTQDHDERNLCDRKLPYRSFGSAGHELPLEPRISPPIGRDQNENCSICLQEMSDLAMIHPCNHAYDFHCIRRWSVLSRSCPLCKQDIQYIDHHFRGAICEKYCPQTKRPLNEGIRSLGEIRRLRRRHEHARRFQRGAINHENANRRSISGSSFMTALQYRQYVYDNGLISKYIGANKYSNFMPFTAEDIKENRRNLWSKASMFLRRDLEAFRFLNGNREFLLQYILAGVLAHLDIQSEGAHKLVSDFLGENYARTLLHELRTFLRSPTMISRVSMTVR